MFFFIFLGDNHWKRRRKLKVLAVYLPPVGLQTRIAQRGHPSGLDINRWTPGFPSIPRLESNVCNLKAIAESNLTVFNLKAIAELNFVSDQTWPRLCRCLFTATTTCLELLWLTSVWLSSTRSQGELSGDSSRVTKTKSQTSASGKAHATMHFWTVICY